MRQLVAFFVLLSCLVAASKAAESTVEDLAQLVCKVTKGTKHQIANTANLSELVHYLGGLSEGHKLYNCRLKYFDSLEELLYVVETAVDDVCGEEKLFLIEAYHYKYVSKIVKYRMLRKGSGEAPKMAKLFFLQFASLVSDACEQGAISSISAMMNEGEHAFSDHELAAVEKLSRITDTLGMTDLSKGYKGIYLFWNMVDSLGVADQEKFAKYLTRAGDVRVNVQMRDASTLARLRAVCKHLMEPLYSMTLLPVLRLVDLGYYPSGKQLEQQLTSQYYTKILFYATQICETFKPVQVFSDTNLTQDQLVILTIKEAEKLTPPKVENESEMAGAKPSVNVAPRSITLDSLVDGSTPIEEIKSHVASRSKVVNKLLKQLVKHLKGKLKPTLGKFKLFHKNRDQKLEPIDEEVLERVDEENSLQLREVQEGELSRKKRGFWYNFGYGIYSVLMVVLSIIFIIVWYVVKVAVLIWPSIPVGFFALCKYEPARKLLKAMWNFGPEWKPIGAG